MSEGPESQRYCGNCGAEVRPDTSFCVSCGRPVNGGPASPGPNNPVPPLPPPSRSLADTLREAMLGLTRRFSNARSASGGASFSGLPNRLTNWFRDLPSVPKLIIVGVLLLILLTVFSPIARVVAFVVLVVSAVVLIARAIQRRPLRKWVIAVIVSLVLIPVFGGISGAMYGSGSTENSDSYGYFGTAVEPQYAVEDETSGPTPEGYSFGLLNVTSDLVDQQSLQRIAQEIQPQNTNYDAMVIVVYDSDEAYYQAGAGPRYLTNGEVFRGVGYKIQIANTLNGESVAGVDAEVGVCLIESLKYDSTAPGYLKLLDTTSFEC